MSIPDSGLRYGVQYENDLFLFHCRVIREQSILLQEVSKGLIVVSLRDDVC